MGLALEVGIYGEVDGDEEGMEFYRDAFVAVNEFLQENGLPPHVEPAEVEHWDGEMFGYSGLHYLRRVAAHLDAFGELPSPGTDESADDPVLEAYFNDFIGLAPGFLRRLFRKTPTFARGFDHLIVHGDAEGFYLPQDFDDVLITPDEEVTGGMIGSAPRLIAELDRVAAALEIPDELDAQSDALWEAVETQGEGATTWERYGCESFSCVVLREGARRSVVTSAALVFC